MRRVTSTRAPLVSPCPPLTYSHAFPCSSTELTYKEGGPAAEARFEGGVAGMEARAFRGCGVMTSEPFEVSDGARTPPPTR